MLECGGIGDCKGCQTALKKRLKLSKERSTPKVDVTRYQSIVGRAALSSAYST